MKTSCILGSLLVFLGSHMAMSRIDKGDLSVADETSTESGKSPFEEQLKLERRLDEQAIESNLRSAEQGDAKAQYLIGHAYRLKDTAESFKWYRRAAEQGHPSAQWELGDIYARGNGVPKNDHEAMKWFRKAAEQGDKAMMIEFGMKLSDKSEALKWYARATEGGESRNLLHVGTILATGMGRFKDEKEAVTWYFKAAELGNADAYYNLGMVFANGKGVEKNNVQSYKWFNLAATRGDSGAEKNRDEIAEGMTASQLSEAQDLASTWFLGHPQKGAVAQKRMQYFVFVAKDGSTIFTNSPEKYGIHSFLRDEPLSLKEFKY